MLFPTPNIAAGFVTNSYETGPNALYDKVLFDAGNSLPPL